MTKSIGDGRTYQNELGAFLRRCELDATLPGFCGEYQSVEWLERDRLRAYPKTTLPACRILVGAGSQSFIQQRRTVNEGSPASSWKAMKVNTLPREDSNVHGSRISWKTVPGFLKIKWKYQQPPRGRTGDSTPWLLPLITRTLTGPSCP